MMFRHSVLFDEKPDSVANAVSSLLQSFVTLLKVEGVLTGSLKAMPVFVESRDGEASRLMTSFEIIKDERPEVA